MLAQLLENGYLRWWIHHASRRQNGRFLRQKRHSPLPSNSHRRSTHLEKRVSLQLICPIHSRHWVALIPWSFSRPTFLVKLLTIFYRRYLSKRIDVLFFQLLNTHGHLFPLLCFQVSFHVIYGQLGDTVFVTRQVMLHLFELPSHLFKVTDVCLVHVHSAFI